MQSDREDELRKQIEPILPQGCKLVEIELEGQDVVLYIDGLDAFYSVENPVKAIASAVKKKVLIRGATRADEATARAAIEAAIPPEAGVKDISFCEEFGEVVITALKPGIAIGKGAAVLKEIVTRTGWAPRVLRWPTMPSTVIPGIRGLLLREAADRKKFLTHVAKEVFAPPAPLEMIKLDALGGFREVGRSCILVTTGSSKIIVDCGVNPELLDPARAFPHFAKAGIAVDEISAVVLSHAHLDHCVHPETEIQIRGGESATAEELYKSKLSFVNAFDFGKFKIERAEIFEKVRLRAPRKLYKILTRRSTIITTSWHPFFVYANGAIRTKMACELRAGDLLLRFDGRICGERVSKIVQVDKDCDFVYDLKIPGLHNYIANGLIVHNCGFIPALYAMGYDGPIYTTAPSRDLMALLCFDFIKVLRKTAKAPLYGEKDVRKALARTITRDYGEVTDIAPDCKLVLHNAGHILGSAIVHLHIGAGAHNLVFSGDFKFGPTRLFSPATAQFPRCDTLIIEATYGGRGDVHPPRPAAEARFVEVVAQTLARGGKVLVPVFSVGRSQEVMLVLAEAVRRGALKFDGGKVWLDGMVLEATAIHTCYPEFLRQQLQRAILSDRSPFEAEIFELVKGDREEIVEGPPCVILAPSGMLSGGPALEYLQLLAGDERHTLIFVGYQSVGTLGYKIQRGDREVAILDEEGRLKSIKIAMRVETCEGFSGHSDIRQLIAFINNVRPRPQQIFTVHGDENKCPELAVAISRMLKIEARAPRNLDGIRLK